MSQAFTPVDKLNVYRNLNNGSRTLAGRLTREGKKVFFRYDDHYLSHYHSLSPLKMPFSDTPIQAPVSLHGGIHGVFADCLPDGWGLLLMNRVFREHHVDLDRITPMDRLAYLGNRGIGSLSFEPESPYTPTAEDLQEINTMGREAEMILEGETEDLLAALAEAGGAGGARPKVMIFIDPRNPDRAATSPRPGMEPWLIKFTSRRLNLGHEEGLCEAAYLNMAAAAQLDVPERRVIQAPAPARAWLAVKRFDCRLLPHGFGYDHMHSLCGLLDADYRLPTTDYETLIKTGQVLCGNETVGKALFKRALFNLFAVNQDDHTRNWSFLMNDAGEWRLSPIYDVTFRPTPFDQHAMSFMGFGGQPDLSTIKKLGVLAGFPNHRATRKAIRQVVAAVDAWEKEAAKLGVEYNTRMRIRKRLNQAYQQNKHLTA